MRLVVQTNRGVEFGFGCVGDMRGVLWEVRKQHDMHLSGPRPMAVRTVSEKATREPPCHPATPRLIRPRFSQTNPNMRKREPISTGRRETKKSRESPYSQDRYGIISTSPTKSLTSGREQAPKSLFFFLASSLYSTFSRQAACFSFFLFSFSKQWEVIRPLLSIGSVMFVFDLRHQVLRLFFFFFLVTAVGVE